MTLSLISVAMSRVLLLWGDVMRVKLKEFFAPFPSVHVVDSVEISHSRCSCGLVHLFTSDGYKFIVAPVPESEFASILDSFLVNGFADLSSFVSELVPSDCDDI